MKQHYNEKWLSPLYRGFALSVALLFASTLAMAQLDGTYTINSASATSGTNFKSFTDLATALSSSGVKGAVTVNVVKSSGPYAERVVLPAAKGASSTNTITINGGGELLVNTTNGSTVEFNSADYYTIDSLKIEAQGTGNGTRCVHLWKGANYNTISNSELVISKYSGTSNSTGYVIFSSSKTRNSAAAHGSHNLITKNKMSNGGASASVGPYYGIADYRSSSYSGTTGNNTISDNDMQSVYQYFIYSYYANGFKITGNNLHDNRSNSRYLYPMYNYRGATSTHQIQINDNKLYNLSCDFYMYNMYSAYYCNGTTSMPVELKDNELYNSDAAYYIFGFGGYFSSNIMMSGNSVHDNSADFGVYGFYIYYMEGDFINNTYYNNEGENYNYGVLAGYSRTGLNIAHNTFVLSADAQYYNYGIYAYMRNTWTGEVNVKNNIVVITGDAGRENRFTYSPFNLDKMGVENNDFYADNTSTNVWYTNTTVTDLAAFNTAVGASGSTANIEIDPKFTDLSKGNIIPTNPEIANYGQSGYAAEDFVKVKRTACGPDLGAYEFTVDHSASNFTWTATKECGGFMDTVTFDFTNGTSVAMADVSVYFSINGGTKTIEQIPTVKASGTETYTFTALAEFHEPGNNILEVGLLCDDNTKNNTIQKTVFITPAPHSFEFAEGANFPGYYQAGGSGGTMTNPDVTVNGYEVEYDIVNPAAYPISTYDTDWDLTPSLWTSNGTAVTSGFTFTKPSGTTMGMLAFDPATALSDSLVFVGFTVQDINTGCDSVFGRWVFVPHTPIANWEGIDGCDGDVIAFVNKTTQPVGLIEYTWSFDDPNSGTENNTSTISDPVHRFSTYGSYDVMLTSWNFDYPKFQYSLTQTVNISPVPTVCFKVKNACEGNNLEFINCTTAPVSGTIDYRWNFGDGTAVSTMKDPKHQYQKAGGYPVTLSASLKGCVSSLKKNANQFATPVADFTVAGTCNLEDIAFTNGTTISLGNTGFAWDFGDNTVSNLSNPSHAFSAPGSQTVKLIAISEFGCKHEITKSFNLEESPKADFDFTDACNLKDVEFTRGGSLPTGNSIFQWDFDGEAVSVKENPSHLFSTVGVKKVSLLVSSDNGCSDMIAKEFVVKLQAKANFIATDVCEGDEVVFTNKSEVASGNLNYEWRYGDAGTSNLTSPRHAYMLQTSGVTESFNVTLLAIVPGGCSDSIAKTVTVNAKSDASFTAQTSGRTVTVSPATTDPTNTYNWRFGDGGRSGDVSPTYEYTNVDEGSFTICLTIINNAGCESEDCNDAMISLLGLQDVNNTLFNVYPNPNRGMFNVKVNNAQSNLAIVVMDATGKTIRTINAVDATGIYGVDISDVAAGVYLVQVTNGNTTAVERVTISK